MYIYTARIFDNLLSNTNIGEAGFSPKKETQMKTEGNYPVGRPKNPCHTPDRGNSGIHLQTENNVPQMCNCIGNYR